MTKSILDAIEAADKAATAAPWIKGCAVTGHFIAGGDIEEIYAAAGPSHQCGDGYDLVIADAELIALMRNNIKALLDVARAAQNIGCQKMGGSCMISGFSDLVSALKKLEAE